MFFYPIIHFDLHYRAVYNAERLIFHDSFLQQKIKRIQLCRVVCITRNFSDPQNLRFINKSGFNKGRFLSDDSDLISNLSYIFTWINF